MIELPETTISVQNSGNYDKIQLEHDNRKRDENGHPYFSKNVDSSLSQNNWYWSGNMSIRDFYTKEFEEFFSLQTEKIRASHPERLEGRAATYYEQVMREQLEGDKLRADLKLEGLSEKEINKRMSAISKIAYQTIIQFGDRDSEFGTLNGTEQGREIAKKVMREFIDKWQQDHPQMKFINVAIHMDEVGADGKGGTVHAHITYCPVCTSYKKGMPVRNSLTGALKQMGYEADKKKNPETGEFQFAIEKWQQDMRDTLEQMLSRYGYHRLTPEDTRTGHESIADYGKRKDQMRKLAEQEERQQAKEQQLSQKEKSLAVKEREFDDMKSESFAEFVDREQDIIEKHQELTDREKAIDTKQAEVEDREYIVQQRELELSQEVEASIQNLKIAVDDAVTNFTGSTAKRANDYPPAKFTKGCRAVPDEDLEQLVKNSWFRPEYVKEKMDAVIDRFNELPFVQSAYRQLHRLEQQIQNLQTTIIKLKSKVQELTRQNREQKQLLDKAKEVRLAEGKTFYDKLVEYVAKDRAEQDHDRYL